ncbi:MAG: cyclic nucleotide-binding domain-containing protein [Leptospiraceae bacterium]|nr:cyclic nucleotide-binding domain-containing protein [Leptospiraceae bacterium]MCP5499385.1 cyclic nucleotide-binding domain-containing protein [Leptospiraceae bacterium]
MQFGDELSVEEYGPGDLIFEQAQFSLMKMYYISQGSVDIFKQRAGKRHFLVNIPAKEFFGEIGLLNKFRVATALAGKEGTRLIAINDKNFHVLAAKGNFLFQLLKKSAFRLYLSEIKLLKLAELNPNLGIEFNEEKVSIGDLDILAYDKTLPSKTLLKKSIILKKGEDPGKRIFYVSEGNVSLYLYHAKQKEEAATLTPGEFFGKLDMEFDAEHKFELVVSSDSAKVVIMHYNRFTKLLTENPDLHLHCLKTVLWRLNITEQKIEYYVENGKGE